MEFVYASLILGVFLLSAITLLNYNWTNRQKLRNDLKKQELDYKYKIDKKRIKAKSTSNIPAPAMGGKLATYAQFLPLLSSLDGDQITDLISLISGKDTSAPSGILEDIISNVPPEVIEGFIKGMAEKTQQAPAINYE